MGNVSSVPSTTANDATVGTVDWTNLTAGATSDDTYISGGGTNITMKYLKATNFGFTIPDGVTITGILVEIERKCNLAITDNSIKIVKGGTISGTEKSVGLSWSSLTDRVDSFGGQNDLWGLSWTPSDINSSGFGVVVSCTSSGGSFNAAFIDKITITVYYSSTIQGVSSIQGIQSITF